MVDAPGTWIAPRVAHRVEHQLAAVLSWTKVLVSRFDLWGHCVSYTTPAKLMRMTAMHLPSALQPVWAHMTARVQPTLGATVSRVLIGPRVFKAQPTRPQLRQQLLTASAGLSQSAKPGKKPSEQQRWILIDGVLNAVLGRTSPMARRQTAQRVSLAQQTSMKTHRLHATTVWWGVSRLLRLRQHAQPAHRTGTMMIPTLRRLVLLVVLAGKQLRVPHRVCRWAAPEDYNWNVLPQSAVGSRTMCALLRVWKATISMASMFAMRMEFSKGQAVMRDLVPPVSLSTRQPHARG